MTADYQELPKVTPPLNAAVPPITDLMNCLMMELGQYHHVVDLANAFFSTGIAPESWEQFASHGKGDSGLSQCCCRTTFTSGGTPLAQPLAACSWAINESKVQGPGLFAKFLGVIWPDKMKAIPGAMIDKIQVHPWPTKGIGLEFKAGLLQMLNEWPQKSGPATEEPLLHQGTASIQLQIHTKDDLLQPGRRTKNLALAMDPPSPPLQVVGHRSPLRESLQYDLHVTPWVMLQNFPYRL
ncbi:hypothetical protein AAY473_007603 [Plecturocebus cupreus]